MKVSKFTVRHVSEFAFRKRVYVETVSKFSKKKQSLLWASFNVLYKK